MSLDHAANFVKRQTVSADAFLGGRLTVSQPRAGFRAGFDSVLLGAAVGATSTNLLELGAGAGVPSLVALSHNPALRATLIENDPAVVPLANANVNDNAFGDRARVVPVDLTLSADRSAGGIPPDAFTTVIANPPFFDGASGTGPAPGREAARHMSGDLLEAWVRAAATHAAHNGEVIFIHVPQSLPGLLAAFTPRFGAITILPLAPRAGDAAIRVLVRGLRGSRAPLQLLATRVLHASEGHGFAPAFEAIFRGTAVLDW